MTSPLLICPDCQAEVKEEYRDDVQKWYICPIGHRTAAPIKREIDGIEAFQRKFAKHLIEHPLTEEEKEKLKKAAEIQAEQNGEDKDNNKPESQAERVYKLFQSQHIELFCDQNKTEYARIPILNNATNAINGIPDIYNPSNIVKEDKRIDEKAALQSVKNSVESVNSVISYENVRLKDEKLKTYLSHLLYEAEQKILNRESTNQVILLLKYDASKGKQYTLYNRVAPDPSGNGSIWLDIADQQNRAYHITKNGWTIETHVPILFRRYEHQQPLVIAVKGGDPKKLLPFVNIGANKNSELTRHRQLLLLVQTASYIVPEIAHPINAMFGCPGSHKSSAQRYIKEIFDKSSVPLINRLPRDENAALQVLDHHYIPIFDNLDYLPRWFSDMLCGAVTGAGMESRVLYTDDDSFIRSFRRCILLNGLNLPATKGDIINRTIMHPTEPTSERRTETELNKEYAKVLPEILGGFLDVLVKALQIKDTIKPSKLFRLADFTEWGCLLAVGLGESADDFIIAMDENLNNQNAADIEGNIVADMFLQYIANTLTYANATEDNPIKLTPEQVFREVSAYAETIGITTKNKRWSSAPHAFTRKLNDSKAAIIANKWNFEVSHDGHKRIMSIWRLESNPKNRWIVKEIPQGEQCDGPYCNFALNVAFEITNTKANTTVKRCKTCLDEMKKKYKVDDWKLFEGDSG